MSLLKSINFFAVRQTFSIWKCSMLLSHSFQPYFPKALLKSCQRVFVLFCWLAKISCDCHYSCYHNVDIVAATQYVDFLQFFFIFFFAFIWVCNLFFLIFLLQVEWPTFLCNIYHSTFLVWYFYNVNTHKQQTKNWLLV